MCQMCALYNPYGETDILDGLHSEPSEIERIDFTEYDVTDPQGLEPTDGDLDAPAEPTTPPSPFLPATPTQGFGDSTSFSGSSGNPLIDGVLRGLQWTVGVTVTFSFPDESTDYGTGYPGDANNENFGELSAAHQALTRLMLEGETWISFEGFTLANVVDSGDDPNALIRSAYSSDAGSTAYAYYPSDSDVGGDIWYSLDVYDYDAPVQGSYEALTTIHEIGHALGLSHGHSADAGFDALPVEYDHLEYSVMTYRSYEGHGLTGYVNAQFSYPQSFMMADIAALQYMYGADFTLNDGDTVYTFSPTTGEMFIDGVGQGAPGGNVIFQTLWDGDGVDTYDLSNYTNTVILTLEAGEASEFSHDQLANLGGGPNGGLARGNLYNALMYDDGTGPDTRSLIENAIGGSGADVIGGNQVDNTLTGNDGHDAMIGFGGDDTLYGGNGSDLLVGAEDGDDLYGGDGNDRLFGDEYELAFGTGLINDLTGALSNTTLATAYSVDSEFTYNYWSIPNPTDPSDTIFSDDVVQHAGFTPFVTIAGAAQGGEILYYSFTVLEDNTRVVLDIDGGGGLGVGDFDSFITLYDATGTEIGSSDDSATSDGSGGSASTLDSFLDMMIATAGVYTIAVGAYSFNGVSAETGAMVVGSTFGLNISIYGETIAPTVRNTLDGAGGTDLLYGGAGNDLLDGGSGIDSLYGGSGLDRLAAGGGADFANGGGGHDSINGGGGNDLLVGGGGNDTLIGGSGIDTLRGSVGADSMNGGSGIDMVSYSSDTVGVTVDLSTNTVSGGEATGDIILNFEQVTGGAGNDVLTGDTGDNALIGGGGNDVITGGLGNDRLVGGDGDDRIRGGDGGDRLRGGRGEDTLLYTTDTAGVQVDLQSNVATGGEATGDDIGAFENVFGGGGNDTLWGTGGNNELKGNGGDDRLYGRNGDDTIVGGGGDDIIRGGNGFDVLTGSGGADVFEFLADPEGSVDIITDFQVGSDTIRLYGVTAAAVSLDNTGANTVVVVSGVSDIYLTGVTITNLNDFDFV